jgi:hypothetical protein
MEDVEDLAEDRLIAFLEQEYDCHTVILYGSRALGKAKPTSDWDVIGINDWPTEAYCHHNVEGVGPVNGYIYPEAMAHHNPLCPSKLFAPANVFATRLCHGIVLIEKDTLGTDIVERAKRYMQSGPGRPSEALAKNMHHYLFSMRLKPYLNPATPLKEGLPEILRDFMRHEALLTSFQQYFWLRGIWPPSPIDGYEYLKENDPQALEAFERANSADASHRDFESLFHLIMDPG